MAEFWSQHRSRLLNILLWLIVLVPVFGCGLLMKWYTLNQRFLDDFVWAQDLITWKEGRYWDLYHAIFQVHLEHRPALARGLALLVTLLAKGDVQAQNALTFLWLLVSFAAMCWLWIKRGGMTIREAWLPLFFAAGMMFSPIQWQNLLWPICHETPMPITFLLLSLCLGYKSGSWVGRCVWGTVYAILGMLSFASGFLLWGLPLPMLLWVGNSFTNRQRWKFIFLWGSIFTVVMLVYMQVWIQPHKVPQAGVEIIEKTLLHLPGGYDLIYDLHNEVPPSYAYHHGNENTMNGEFAYFVEHPLLDLQFVATFCGAVLVRGWSAEFKIAAMNAGWFLLGGFALAVIYFWRHRKDAELRARLMPALFFGAYTPLTAAMVAVGRIYAGGTGSALNGRYVVHQTVLVVAIIWAGTVIMRHQWQKRGPSDQPFFRPSVNVALAGVLAGIILVGWVHGQAMMYEWQAGRYRASAAQYLSQVFDRRNHYVGFVAGNFEIAKDTAAALDRYGLLRNGLAKDSKLSTFKIASSKKLDRDHGQFQRLYKVPDWELHRIGFPPFVTRVPFYQWASEWQVQGYAYLPGSQRPADAIVLAYRVPGGEWTMFALTQAYGAPHYLARSMGKDMYSLIPGRDTWPNRIMCSWDPDIHIQEEPPPNALITAWAVDMERHRVFRVPRPEGGLVLTDPSDGVSLADLARDVPRDDQ